MRWGEPVTGCQGKSIPDRKNSKFKTPEAWVCLVYLKTGKEPPGEGARKRQVEVKDGEVDGVKLCSTRERCPDLSRMGREATGEMLKTSMEWSDLPVFWKKWQNFQTATSTLPSRFCKRSYGMRVVTRSWWEMVIFRLQDLLVNLNVGYEEKKEVKNNSQISGLQLSFTEDWQKQFGRRHKNLEMLCRHWIFKSRIQERGWG